MGPGETVRVADFLDGEGLGPVGAVQLFEPIHWNTGSPRHKLQKAGPKTNRFKEKVINSHAAFFLYTELRIL